MFQDVNFLAVAVAAVASFLIGMLWYSPLLFGNVWLKLQGFSAKDMEKAKSKGMGKTMLIGFLSTFVMIIFLDYFLQVAGTYTLAAAVQTAFLLWFGFFATSMLGKVLWEGKKVQLYWIDSMYYLVVLTASASILTQLV